MRIPAFKSMRGLWIIRNMPHAGALSNYADDFLTSETGFGSVRIIGHGDFAARACWDSGGPPTAATSNGIETWHAICNWGTEVFSRQDRPPLWLTSASAGRKLSSETYPGIDPG